MQRAGDLRSDWPAGRGDVRSCTPAGRETSAERRPNPRLLRGGAFNNQPANVRSANRNRNAPTNRNTNNGFRLASTCAGGISRTAGIRESPAHPGVCFQVQAAVPCRAETVGPAK